MRWHLLAPSRESSCVCCAGASERRCASKRASSAQDLHGLATFSDGDALGSDLDAVVCAFGLRHKADRRAALAKWRDALGPKGKLGLMMWGPAQPDDPQDWLATAAREIDPALDFARVRIDVIVLLQA